MENEEGSSKNPLFKQHVVKISVSRNILYWLILWGKVNNRKKNAFASQIVTSRVNDHVPAIDTEIERWATREGMTKEELITAILKEENYPFLDNPESANVLEESDEVE